ncbi:selenium cofactor biosynthesis protein YqeC [Fusibacter sp. 3D3]|uniref:selenium cofactor biosynthesis protein YqeC n=1 Tax=Fusibacter sp. 3D3 TaxID=1048380 RepID=UPI000853207C|nr:selenium cofactor biosynthesis protein YqeC [Fusibacter sp. 3D3]GAU77100.1 accessory protein YqeC in selenium-dependent molybdenum hydroxylase maturation [Fusibacter sp. 3D3]
MCTIKKRSGNDFISGMTIEALVRMKLNAAKVQHKTLVVSVVGAGGKTSLIYYLVNALKSEFKILVTTTTMMFKPTCELDHLIYQGELPAHALLEKLATLETLTVAELSATSKPVTGLFQNEVGEGFDIDESPVIKLKGVSETLVDQIAAASLYDLILVEADGSRRRPLKAYGPHEPVLPQCSDVTIAVMGLKGLNVPISEESVHRLDHFLKLTGKKQGEMLQIEDLVALFSGETGFLKAVPKGCDVIAFLNQADCATLPHDFENITEKLFDISPSIEGFFVVSLEKHWTYAAYLSRSEGEA